MRDFAKRERIETPYFDPERLKRILVEWTGFYELVMHYTNGRGLCAVNDDDLYRLHAAIVDALYGDFPEGDARALVSGTTLQAVEDGSLAGPCPFHKDGGRSLCIYPDEAMPVFVCAVCFACGPYFEIPEGIVLLATLAEAVSNNLATSR